ncbi:hypothetical protein GLAREA_11337 [Glarea lozoyensis ATCC 20868]|uniref:Uncharacterized protein n=1 Tax=Glarea lozoyensis (strain ATCC 20868 / MF5171) TaxID=1116229 RepID=S3DAY6_GLAL2|nr:uncharacterized protein GLAREA_11337 [Glarea lozoyensis ATCC 20868]EPE35637.1 hypothetical protein GLAREA_11337 [Glarea lozoyensis ATCC 20868]
MTVQSGEEGMSCNNPENQLTGYKPSNHVDPIDCKVTGDGRRTLQFSRRIHHPPQKVVGDNTALNPTSPLKEQLHLNSDALLQQHLHLEITYPLANLQCNLQSRQRLVVVDGHQNVLPERIASSVLSANRQDQLRA